MYMASLHLAQEIFNLIYPVGSVYLSVNQTNPSTLFGGTWSRITDGFLYCIAGNGGGQGNLQGSANSAASSGSTGGPSNNNTGSTTLTINQIPAHRHGQLVTANPGTGGTGIRGDYNGEGSGYSGYSQGMSTEYTGGGQGHTHTLNSHTHSLNSHTHNIPYTGVVVWKRTA